MEAKFQNLIGLKVKLQDGSAESAWMEGAIVGGNFDDHNGPFVHIKLNTGTQETIDVKVDELEPWLAGGGLSPDLIRVKLDGFALFFLMTPTAKPFKSRQRTSR